MMPKRMVNTVQSNFLAFLPTSTYKSDLLRAFLPTKEFKLDGHESEKASGPRVPRLLPGTLGNFPGCL